MTGAGGSRRTVWRTAVAVWAVAVVAGGGLTLWLQDTAVSRDGHGRRHGEPDHHYGEYGQACPREDHDDVSGYDGDLEARSVTCAYVTEQVPGPPARTDIRRPAVP